MKKHKIGDEVWIHKFYKSKNDNEIVIRVVKAQIDDIIDDDETFCLSLLGDFPREYRANFNDIELFKEDAIFVAHEMLTRFETGSSCNDRYQWSNKR